MPAKTLITGEKIRYPRVPRDRCGRVAVQIARQTALTSVSWLFFKALSFLLLSSSVFVSRSPSLFFGSSSL